MALKQVIRTISKHKGKIFAGTTLSLFTYGMCRDDDISYIKPAKTVSSGNDDPSDHHRYTLRNKIWSDDELEDVLKTAKQHYEPQTIGQHLQYGILRGAYNIFNFVTRFDKSDPTPQSMKIRLILLESIAGVPPFIVAGYRHFRSLRNLSYDGGRIYTHLEEAENERMHLVSCMQVFEAGALMKASVYGAQFVLTPFCWFFCLVSPRSMNRFVGYLEELACETYSTVLSKVNDPSTKLYAAWHETSAPPVAIEYWQLPENATWPDVLRYIYADETNHRDINHTFADISVNARNPLIHHHVENFEKSVELTSDNVPQGEENE